MAERAHPFDRGFKDKFFGLKKNPYRKLLFERYQYCNQFIRGKNILEIPCGTGWGTSLLSGAKKVVGVDIDADAIDFAKKHFLSQNVEFQVGNMNHLEFAESVFDVVICLEGFEHVSREIGCEFIEEARRVLKREGLLLMTCPVIMEGGQHSGNPYHVYEYPEAELLQILNANFHVVRLEELPAPDNPIIRFVGKNIK